jgi:hypothetical protein
MANDEKKNSGNGKLDRVVAEARKNYDERQSGYRAQALKLYPWICGRCTREFTRANLHELTVHHRDHNHDNNPSDGTNWELLCIYCHENEHARYLDAVPTAKTTRPGAANTVDSHQPFADLKNLFNKKDR